MIGRASALILVAAMGCVASWLIGYHEGQQYGALHLMREMDRSFTLDVKNAMDADRDQICGEIRRYKLSIAKDLDENTQICGYADMDSPENSG
jgi:hypothetical protein